MNLFTCLFHKKKMKLTDCETFRLNKDEADGLFGGFKEYHPILYDLQDNLYNSVPVNNLLENESTNHNFNRDEK